MDNWLFCKVSVGGLLHCISRSCRSSFANFTNQLGSVVAGGCRIARWESHIAEPAHSWVWTREHQHEWLLHPRKDDPLQSAIPLFQYCLTEVGESFVWKNCSTGLLHCACISSGLWGKYGPLKVERAGFPPCQPKRAKKIVDLTFLEKWDQRCSQTGIYQPPRPLPKPLDL